jgi:hypothetical protein
VGVTRRSIRAPSCYPPRAGVVICPGARRVWRMFLQSRYKFDLTLRVSRYKVDRSHGLIPRYKFIGVHLCSVGMQSVSKPVIYPGAGFCYVLMRESGCINHYKSVLIAETKAKTVTSPLIIPSVLAGEFFFNFLIHHQSSHGLLF